MTQESLHRIKRYIQMRDEKPIKHSHDIINGVHAGTEWEAELRLSDIRNVIHEIEKLRAAARDLAKHIWRGDWDKLKPETRELLGEKG